MSVESYTMQSCVLAAVPLPGPAQVLPAVHVPAPPFRAQRRPAMWMGHVVSLRSFGDRHWTFAALAVVNSVARDIRAQDSASVPVLNLLGLSPEVGMPGSVVTLGLTF